MPEELKAPELHKIRIYPENPKLPGVASNLVLELDGKKLEGVFEFTYKINSQNIPIVDIRMMASVEVESHARANLERLNPQQDSVQF